MAAKGLGVFLLSVLGGIRLGQGIDMMNVLLAAQALLAAWLLVRRAPAQDEAAWYWQVFAWCSAALPLLMAGSVYGQLWQWLSVLGVIFTLRAMKDLGAAFAIAPADRGLVTKGLYRLVRHPIYLGELFSLTMLCLAAPGLRNWVLLAVFAWSIRWRIIQEEKHLADYDAYKDNTPWRLIPGLW